MNTPHRRARGRFQNWTNLMNTVKLTTDIVLELRPRAAAFALVAVTAVLSSCGSNEDLQKRLDDRNDWYGDVQERREMRQDARQERTDAWFDRVMH
jgi:hypothetical protein